MWTSGTATDWEDLLDILVTELSTNATLVGLGQHWEVMKDETVANYKLGSYDTSITYTNDFRMVYLRGKGLSDQDNIHVNIYSYDSTPISAYNWGISTATNFDTLEAFEDQPGATNRSGVFYPSFITLSNSVIDYWIIANGRRFFVIAKIEGDFHVMGAGLGLPYAIPTEYPYPCLCFGNSSVVTRNSSSTALYNLWGYVANDNRAVLRDPYGTWSEIGSSSSATFAGRAYSSIWPWSFMNAGGAIFNIERGNTDGSYNLRPAVVYSTQSGNSGVFCEVQGLFYVSGSGLVDVNSEDTITIGGDTYLVVQNVDKTGVRDYAAFLLA